MGKFLTDVDLNQNELQYAVIQNLNTDPIVSTTGQIYYNTNISKLRLKTAAGWITIATGTITIPTLQDVVNAGNGISNFGGIGNASIQSTNFTNNRTLYLNDNAYPTIRLVDNLNASNNLQIDLDTLTLDGVSYNWSTIVNPPNLLTEQTIDAYIGSRLRPTNPLSNGFYVDRNVNGAVGYGVVNPNTGSGAVSSLGAGIGALYTQTTYVAKFGSNYYVPLLAGKGGLLGTEEVFVGSTDGNDVSILTGPAFASIGRKFTVKANGQLLIQTTPTTGTTSDYILLRDTSGNVKQIAYPTIPTTPTLQQVTTAGAITTDVITVGGIISGNLYSDGYTFGISDNFDSNYNLLYIPYVGLTLDDFGGNYTNINYGSITLNGYNVLTTLNIDPTPTNGSTNAVSSDGVFDALGTKQNTLSGTGVVKSTAGTISYINGTNAQYIRGDGTLATFPSTTIPTLQQVTDVGYNTTNPIIIGGSSLPGSTTTFLYDNIQMNVLNSTGGYSNLAWLSPINGLVLKTNPGLSYFSATLKSDLITGTDKVFQFPNNSGTLALTSDIPTYTIPTLQQVTTAGSVTKDLILLENTGVSPNAVILSYQGISLSSTSTGKQISISLNDDIGFTGAGGNNLYLKSPATITGTNTQTLQNASGIVALLSDIPPLSTVYQNEIHVSKDGSDVTGDGTLLKPFASITKGLTLVAGTRKTIILHPGSYSESPSITVQYTVLTTFELLGGNTEIVGTVSTNKGCTFSGVKMTNLTITAPTGTGNVNILNCEISGTLTKSSTADYTLIRFCDLASASITGSGLVAMFGGNPNFITVNNAAARVIIKSAVTVSPVLTAGSLSLVDSIVVAAVTNAFTSAAGTFTTLANSQFLISALNNVAPVVLNGFYSILNCVFDKPNSTLVALSGTGGSLNSIVYSQYINADKFIKQGGTSSQYLMADGSVTTGGSSPLTTKGDLYTFDTVDARLPVGTDGQILTANSSVPEGLSWQDNYADWTSTVKHIVKNNGLSGTITKGTAVYVTSSDGTNMLVGRASNTSEATSSKTMGLMQSNITTTGGTQTGFVITEGLLSGLNTASAVAGDPVWLGVNGALIYGLVNKPYAPDHLVFIGIVTKVSAGNGEIFVKVQNGFELKELHDVQAQNPTLNDILWYDNTVTPPQWKTASIPTILGYTPVTNARTLTINGTAYDLTADRSWTITASGKSINTVSVNTSAGSASSTDYVYLASGTINVTLPTAIGNQNLYTIKNVGTGVITVDTTSSQTIDGSLTAPIKIQYLSLTLVSDGANWNII